MTLEERVTRLEGVVEKMAIHVTQFVDSAAEFNTKMTGALQTVSGAVQSVSDAIERVSDAVENHGEQLQRHDEEIRRLDAMITRFDEWLRGQGPPNGHERR